MDDMEGAALQLERTLVQQYEACFPERRQRMRRENKPWITARILKLMDQRRRAYSTGRMDRWRHLYNKVKDEIKKAKKRTARAVEENNVNSASFSKDLKCILGNQIKKLKIPFLDHLNDQEISQKIKSHFSNICTFFPPIDTSALPSYLPAHDTLEIDRLDVYKDLLTVKTGKASPPGSLPKRLLKEFAFEISEPLTHIFNCCLRNGLFPEPWKLATITALPKKKIVTQLGDLRPLSLTPDLGKMLEGVVARMVLDDIKPNLDHYQYGNLKGSSTSHCLITLLNFILKGLDQPKKIAQVVLIDFKKAFDYIDHTVAMCELYSLGCRPSLLTFIASFLTNRKHRVRYHDTLSDWDITCGVPQGTRLGPIIFLAVVNNICRNANFHVKYVDDLTLAEIIDVKDSINFTMQDTLDHLANDCVTVKMIPNPLKCEVMFVCPPKRPIVFPLSVLNDCVLPVIHRCKLLGVHINSELNWNDHVSHMISKANKCMFILYRARQFSFSQDVMFTLYTWYIRTSLEYAAPVWHTGLTNTQHLKIERIQKRCFRVILGTQYTSYEAALTSFNSQSLYDRREELILRFGKDVIKSDKHRDLLPKTLYDQHGRDTRRGKQLLQTIRCRTTRYQKSSIPYIVRKLNAN